MSTEPPSKKYLLQDGDGKPPEMPPEAPSDARAELVRLLDASEDKHFVFFFGSPAAGKTAVLGSVIQAMQRPEVQGRLFVHGAGDGYFKHGLALWDHIRSAFGQKQFPARTSVGSTIQLHAQYKPPGTGTPMDLIFLEMAGEDLKSVMITDKGGRSLPFHIGQFLRLPQLKVAFIVTTPWQDAPRDDVMIDDFLSYVNETAPHLIESRIILLVTKWDTFASAATTPVEQFVQQRMPRTFNKISAKRNIIQPFSVGKIIPFDGAAGDIIASFDYGASQRLFASIYETFTGISVDKPKKPFWKL
jgi:hypothetical protein